MTAPRPDPDVRHLAGTLRRYGLAAPALLWLEGCRPLSRLLAQGLTAWSPWLEQLLPGGAVRRWRAVCADPDRYAALLHALAAPSPEEEA